MPTAPPPPRLLFISGLKREAAIARGPDALAICGDTATLSRRLASPPLSPRLMISFGLCGGLDPKLRSGDIVIGDRIVNGDGDHMADAGVARELATRLGTAGEPVTTGAIASVDAPVLTRAAKSQIRNARQAVAVDMESLIAARFAADLGLPLAILRVVSDPADRDLPSLILKAVRPDGGTNLGAVAAGAISAPAQIFGLIAAARDSAAAFATLRRCRLLPGLFLGLGLADFRKLA